MEYHRDRREETLKAASFYIHLAARQGWALFGYLWVTQNCGKKVPIPFWNPPGKRCLFSNKLTEGHCSGEYSTCCAGRK